MKVYSGILILLDPLVEILKRWMVSQDAIPDQRIHMPMLKGLLQLYIQINQRKIVLNVVLNTKLGSALHHLKFVTNVISKDKLCHSTRNPSTTSAPTSNRNTRGSWHCRGTGSKGRGSRHAAYEAEINDTSKLIIDSTSSEVDVVKLLQAYGMEPTGGSELKHQN